MWAISRACRKTIDRRLYRSAALVLEHWPETTRERVGALPNRRAPVSRKALVKKQINLVLFVSIFLAGCATQKPEVATYVDPYTHARTDLMAENVLEGPEPVREVVWLNA